jgi:hypothetical protein
MRSDRYDLNPLIPINGTLLGDNVSKNAMVPRVGADGTVHECRKKGRNGILVEDIVSKNPMVPRVGVNGKGPEHARIRYNPFISAEDEFADKSSNYSRPPQSTPKVVLNVIRPHKLQPD